MSFERPTRGCLQARCLIETNACRSDAVCVDALTCARANATSDIAACALRARGNVPWLNLVLCAKHFGAEGCYAETGLRGVPANEQSCRLPLREVILNTLVAGLVAEGRIHPRWAWVDAGTDDGKWPLYYACLASNAAGVEPHGRPADIFTFDSRWSHIAAVSRLVIQQENLHPGRASWAQRALVSPTTPCSNEPRRTQPDTRLTHCFRGRSATNASRSVTSMWRGGSWRCYAAAQASFGGTDPC